MDLHRTGHCPSPLKLDAPHWQNPRDIGHPPQAQQTSPDFLRPGKTRVVYRISLPTRVTNIPQREHHEPPQRDHHQTAHQHRTCETPRAPDVVKTGDCAPQCFRRRGRLQSVEVGVVGQERVLGSGAPRRDISDVWDWKELVPVGRLEKGPPVAAVGSINPLDCLRIWDF